MTKQQAADRAIAAFDAYIFTVSPVAYDSEKASTLAAVAVVECDEAANDMSVNAFTRKEYRKASADMQLMVY